MHKGDSICIHCGKSFKDNPRVKEQEYCNRDECQRARRSRWQKEKMRNDADYRDNQKRCWKEWVEKHHGYWEKYRAKNPDYVKRNRELQYIRDARRRKRWRDNVLHCPSKYTLVTSYIKNSNPIPNKSVYLSCKCLLI